MRRQAQRGIAATEFAVFLPVFVLMIMLTIEGASALRTYMTLSEASREGARLVLSEDGQTVHVEQLVRTITADLPGEEPTTAVSFNPAQETVTVEVNYAYQGFFGAGSVIGDMAQGALMFTSRTVMPLP